MGDVLELVSAYFDGVELSPEEVLLIEQWIGASKQNADHFTCLFIENQCLRSHIVSEHSAGLVFLDDAGVGGDFASEQGSDRDEDPQVKELMEFLVDQALAERRRHELELEDEANRQLAAQQSEVARSRESELKLRRQASPSPVQRVIVIPKPLVWLGLAAVLLLGVVLIGVNLPPRTPAASSPSTARQNPQDLPATLGPVATLTLLEDAVWSGADQPMSLHSRVKPGALRLESGVAHFVMDSGAVVMIKGPATIDLSSPWVAKLSEGSAVARVPEPAQGFKIVGDGFAITDLGTEFAVHVDHDGMQCRVLLGEVELVVPEAGNPRPMPLRLRENRLVRLDAATGEINELSPEDAEDIAWALPYADSLGRNLVVNGDFEWQPAPVFTPGEPAPTQAIPGWIDRSAAITVAYEQVSAFESWPDFSRCPLPSDAGEQFLVTVGDWGVVYQEIDIASLAALTDQGVVQADLSAWLGGYDMQDQYAVVSVEFLDERGRVLDTIVLDPVRPADRGFACGFLLREGADMVPAQSRSARVRIESAAGEPDDVCDGYVDNVELVFHVERTGGDAPR